MKKYILVFLLITLAFANLKSVEIDTVWMRATPTDIYSVSFHPNNKIFATGTGDHVGIWDVATATETRMYEGISSGNSFFSKTGKYLIHSFQIDNEEGYKISTYPQDSLVFTYKHTINNSLIRVAISSDEKYFAVKYNSVFLQIWDIQTGKKIKQYDSLVKSTPDIKNPDNAGVGQIEFSPDGTKIAFIGQQGNINSYNIKLNILDLVKDSIIYSTQIGEQGVIKYSNDGTKIAFTSPNKNESINVMDLNTKQIIGKIDGLSQGIGQMLFSQNDKYLIYNQGSIFIYDLILNKKSFVYDYQTTFENYSLSNDLKYFASNAGPYLLLLNAKFSNTNIDNPTNAITSIFPNPTSGLVTISTSCLLPQIQYTITNQLGQLISTNIIQNINNQIRLNFTPYPNGVYFIKIQCNQDISNYKIIKE